jgi:hypothetical protein
MQDLRNAHQYGVFVALSVPYPTSSMMWLTAHREKPWTETAMSRRKHKLQVQSLLAGCVAVMMPPVSTVVTSKKRTVKRESNTKHSNIPATAASSPMPARTVLEDGGVNARGDGAARGDLGHDVLHAAHVVVL